MPTDDTVSVRNDGEWVRDESETNKENSKQANEHGETNEAKKFVIEVPPIKIPFSNRQFKSKLDQQFDILTRKRVFNEVETVAFTEECSAFSQNKYPPKLKDLGSFTIPCHIGRLFIDKVLRDLSATVSVMPLSVSSKLNMRSLKVSNITLEMVNHSVKYLLSILEDMPARVGKLFTPVDFVVLDMEEDTRIPINLGRPFLHTACAVIDVKNGNLTLCIRDDEVTFNLSIALESPMLEGKCYSIDVVDVICHDINDPSSLWRSLGGVTLS
ncbi:uncharacterized protein LOC104883291 [Beta vulgaris subsp. vulgaris]|uniref:uncharacterized protein LOC104883291 n=1 Tax=Beta vulgaris subsp. vulgaris TaxID=3555 RepID=UPI00203742FC|nr:uncharacterized protein LOC104883291 [Beta vulgaris subsp. vulgaris]